MKTERLSEQRGAVGQVPNPTSPKGLVRDGKKGVSAHAEGET